MQTTETATYDDIHSFAVVMHDIEWKYSDEPGERVLEYFDKPHKWDKEYQKWRNLGGSLDKSVTDAFEKWMESRCSKCGQSPDEGTCMYCEPDEEEQD